MSVSSPPLASAASALCGQMTGVPSRPFHRGTDADSRRPVPSPTLQRPPHAPGDCRPPVHTPSTRCPWTAHVTSGSAWSPLLWSFSCSLIHVSPSALAKWSSTGTETGRQHSDKTSGSREPRFIETYASFTACHASCDSLSVLCPVTGRHARSSAFCHAVVCLINTLAVNLSNKSYCPSQTHLEIHPLRSL